MNTLLKISLSLVATAMVSQATAQITFYEHDDFVGRSLVTDRAIEDFSTRNFNDTASSAVVVGGPWEVCEDAQFRGRCVLLQPGKYPSLGDLGLNDSISSVRLSRAPQGAMGLPEAAATVALPDYRPRNGERLYEVHITSVRAVAGPPEQRCWIEREQLAQEQQGGANVPGAIVGALIGGILGHQVGGGSGKDLATVGGFVAGAAIGANAGRDNAPQQASTRDVRRCENVAGQVKPQYWDVSYNFQGQQHRVQMTQQPGQTLIVNERGEPRIIR